MSQKQIYPPLIIYIQYMAYNSGAHGNVCTYICHINITCIKHLKQTTANIFHSYISCYWYIALYKYGCHSANISHNAITLYRHVDPTVIHICVKTQATTIPIWYVIAIHVPEINMSTKLHICHVYYNCDGHIWRIHVHKGTHMKSICIYHLMSTWTLYQNTITCNIYFT